MARPRVPLKLIPQLLIERAARTPFPEYQRWLLAAIQNAEDNKTNRAKILRSAFESFWDSQHGVCHPL